MFAHSLLGHALAAVTDCAYIGASFYGLNEGASVLPRTGSSSFKYK